MSRFLFVVLPLGGHIHAPLAVGAALMECGHEVAWCGPKTFLRPLVGDDATIYPTGMRLYREQGEHGLAALRSLWEGYLVPFTRFVLPAADEAVARFHPDVVVVDQHALAGALVAHRHGLPWASLAPGAMELTRPLRKTPDVETWVREQIARVWAMAGMPVDECVDLRFSPYLVIAFTSSALTGVASLPQRCVLVGPALGRRPADPDFAWEWLDAPRRHLLVTVGTLAESIARDFYARAVAALAPLARRVQAIVVAPDDVVPEPPEHILVAQRVPMLELMPRLDAVVCHGGMGTVGEALAHGVPLVLAPIRYDQPVVTEQVVAAGAGVRVDFAQASPAQLRAAITAVLDETTYRDGARRVRESFTAAGGPHGGAARAATHLAALAAADPLGGQSHPAWV